MHDSGPLLRACRARKIDLIQGRIARLLVDIRDKGHGGMKVVLVGVPYMGLDVDYMLADTNPLPPNVEDYPVAQEIRASGDTLERVQRGAVDEANQLAGTEFAVFESVHDLFRGREFDPNLDVINPDRLVRGLEPEETFGFPSENFHYTAEGHELLGSHLCTRSDYGAAQLVVDPTGGNSKQDLLVALFSFLAATIGVFTAVFCFTNISSSKHGCPKRFSQKWSDTIISLQLPIKKVMIAVSCRAALNPGACLAVGFSLSIFMFASGYALNFNVVSEQITLTTPRGSRSEVDGEWVRTWFNSSQGGKNGDGSGDNNLLSLVIHKDGEDVLSKEGVAALFEAIDVVRNTTGYHSFCAKHGKENVCPVGYEYICQLYGIPTGSELPKNCRIIGPTGFWFHNHTVFDQQVNTDREAAEAMSLDIFPG